MSETTRLPVEAGWYMYQPTGAELWAIGIEPTKCEVKIDPADDKLKPVVWNIWHEWNQLPGTFTGPIEGEASE
jgi:hypothetical protein